MPRTSTELGISFAFVILSLICFLMWIIQSLPTLRKLQRDDEERCQISTRTHAMDSLALPAVVICNRLPYSLAGINSIDDTFNQELILRYLVSWFDPSSADDPFSSDSTGVDQVESAGMRRIVSQLLPNAGLMQRMEQVLLKCNDFIASCSFGSSAPLNGQQCCEYVDTFIPTLEGICWVFRNASLFVQTPYSSAQGLQLTFQIARNQFQSNSQNFHPGIDLFLVPADEQDKLRTATELSAPIRLRNKQARELLIRQENKTCLTSRKYGVSVEEEASMEAHTDMQYPSSATVTCLLQAAARECACMPLTAVLWALQGDIPSSFLRRLNVSSICGVEEYNNCAKQYVNFARPKWWNYQVPASKPALRESVNMCLRDTHIPCQQSSYVVTSDETSDLPPDYQHTQDFIARFSVAYDSFMVTEVVEDVETETSLSHTLIVLGYNLATWFAVGHIIWSLLTFILHSTILSPVRRSRVTPKGQITQISGPVTHGSGRQPTNLSATYTTSNFNHKPKHPGVCEAPGAKVGGEQQ